jgi:hypothetical protein
LISPREWERTANGGWNGLIYQYWLVVQCAHLWKMMEFVNGKDDIPYRTWKITNVW